MLSRLASVGPAPVTLRKFLGRAEIKTTMRDAHVGREAKTSTVRRFRSDKVETTAGSGKGRAQDRVTPDASCGKIRVVRCGEVRERLNRAVSKTVEPLRVPWVRIPPSPPE